MKILYIIVLLISSSHSINIATTFKPITSIVIALCDGVDGVEIHQILDDKLSPHSASISPSGSKFVKECDLIIGIGSSFETGLSKIFSKYSNKSIELQKIEGINILNSRNKCGHHHSHHHHNDVDGHFWVDPIRMKVAVYFICKKILEIKKDEKITNNLKKIIKQLDVLHMDFLNAFSKINKEYLITHDSLQYLDSRYGLKCKGVIFSNNKKVSAKNLKKISMEIKKTPFVFYEYGFDVKKISEFTGNYNISYKLIDITGYDVCLNKHSYFTMMDNVKNEIVKCLSKKTQKLH